MCVRLALSSGLGDWEALVRAEGEAGVPPKAGDPAQPRVLPARAPWVTVSVCQCSQASLTEGGSGSAQSSSLTLTGELLSQPCPAPSGAAMESDLC